jgi:hypothetical protein
VYEYVKNGLAGTYVLEGGLGHCYATYVGMDQLDGMGNGSDGLFDNRTVIMDSNGNGQNISLANVVSPVGSAVRAWGATG